LPTTTTPPDTAALPPAAGASAATPWDRLETDIQALKQQALATQKSIQQLQTHEAPDPLQTVQSALPALPDDWDGMVVGVAAGLGLTLALVWWALWVRPQSRLRRAEAEFAGPSPSVVSPGAEPPSNSNLARLRRLAQDGLPTQSEPHPGFNSEAAANEVSRVRKSLAEKREARTLQREHEETTQPLSPQARAWLDPDRPDPLDGVVVNSGPVPMASRAPDPAPLPPPDARAPVIDITVPEPMMDLDLDLGSEAAPLPEPQPQPLPEMPPEPSLSLEPAPTPAPTPTLAPQPEPAPEPDPSAWPDTDFGITLALAQESEALDLWPEARELATEVLESPAPDLRGQALALLARLDARDQALAREAQLPPPEAQDETGA